MYKRISMVMFPVLALALIVVSYWGYTQLQMRNKIMVKAENQYQRSFHNLSYHLDRLHEELGNTLAMSTVSSDTYRKGLMNIWRLTNEAKSSVSQLPLYGMEFSKTEQFLTNVANFSYLAGVRDYAKKPLNEKEMKTLDSLYKHSAEISNEIRGLQAKTLSTRMSWSDVELALSSDKGPHDNMIVDGFQAMEKQVSGYDDVEWDPAVVNMHRKNNFNELDGKEETPEEIRHKAAQFWNADPNAIQVTENGKGTKTHTYSASMNTGSGTLQMDFSRKGGQPFYFSNHREIGKATLDMDQAISHAKQFLDHHNYKDMIPVTTDHAGPTADITFAREQNNVKLYPEKILLKVALDNGEVVGMQATDYVFNHKDRQIAEPKVSVEEARKNISERMNITQQGLAVIKNNVNEEVLCHEFFGQMNNTNYRIYINAETGAEEKIEPIKAAGQALLTQ